MTTTAARNLALGQYGETLAVRHLTQRGMVLLDRNWRCDAGEIDLVLRDGPVLVVCEVKTRSSTERGTPHEAVDEVKLARLQRLGERWRQARGIGPVDIRVDLVAVLRPRKGASVVEHVAGIG
ncbi:YraN family protein [Nocardioides sp. dk4132]|uniref:YraN family protein n=1 Tax=unclassified Nocardioides TaxID=2615069 RepID=UPI0012955378|nr:MULTISPECIES: YraN family protein [unclassified Nocardioides]MQW77675.1 YraN family protein [Nocardioides sp. dk4132]QGA07129.1 YraN family protein [Nocardioides sp. dk884]